MKLDAIKAKEQHDLTYASAQKLSVEKLLKKPEQAKTTFAAIFA